MSTFEGRQITQLICPKPAKSSPQDAAQGDEREGAPGENVVMGDQENSGNGQGVFWKGAGGQTTEVAGAEGVGVREEATETGFDTRERGEAFMCISLEVQNMIGVEEALKKLTEKEIIKGYNWDEEVGRVFEMSRCFLHN